MNSSMPYGLGSDMFGGGTVETSKLQVVSTTRSLVVPCCMHFVLVCIVYQNNYYKYYRNHQNVLKFNARVEFFE